MRFFIIGDKKEFLRLLRNIVIALTILALIGIFFSYKLLEIPGGLTSDEAAFGYNAVLLERTLHDQNGRFMPVFVLSLNGKDWRQPVTQYYLVAFFKIFGASVFNLRFSSVVITLFATVLIFFLAAKLLGKSAAFLASFLFLTTPLVMIQSHMGLDNIMPIPFTLLWLSSLYYFHRERSLKFLLLAGIILGIGFYTYKGMRAIVPVWSILTIVYLKLAFNDSFKIFLKRALFFALSILPFFAVIPILEAKYAGAVFDRQRPSWDSVYTFLYPYFSSFDPSFLFIKGDELLIHSTGKHGMMLLASLPLFVLGCCQAVKKRKFWLLILAAFFLAPFLYGLVGSVHRASRLMAIIPLYSLLATFGGIWLWETKIKGKFIITRTLLLALLVLIIINYGDFTRYYWFIYPKSTAQENNLLIYKSYQALAEQAKKRGFEPYIDSELRRGENELFFESIYFDQPLGRWMDKKDTLPKNSILLSNRRDIPNLERLEINLPYHYLQINTK